MLFPQVAEGRRNLLGTCSVHGGRRPSRNPILEREYVIRIKLGTSLLILFLFAGCAPTTPMVQPTLPAVEPAATLPPPTPGAALPFEPALYRDDANGFEFDYPADWSLDPNSVIGSRATQALLLSPGTTAEALAEAGSRLSIVVYDWEPKGDLAAYVAQRRLAWDSSGFKVMNGSMTALIDGRPASDFFIEPPGGSLSYFLLTPVGDRYLQLAGEGDLALIESIARTLRPVRTTAP